MANIVIAPLVLTAALGEDRTFAGTVQLSGTDTTPVNITGWTIVVTLKKGATTVTISASVTLGTAGTYSWTLVAANNVTLGVGDSAIDVWRTDAGAATIINLGTFSITPEVRV